MAHGISDDLVRRLAEYHDRLDAAQARGESALAEAFDHPPRGVGVHEIDGETLVLRVNGEELRLLGYTREEMVGRRVIELIVMNETAERAIGKKIAGGAELKPFVRTFKKRDGTPIALVLLDRHLRDAAGHVVGLRTVLAEAGSAGGE